MLEKIEDINKHVSLSICVDGVLLYADTHI